MLHLLLVVNIITYVLKNMMVQHGPQVGLYQTEDIIWQERELKMQDLLLVDRMDHYPVPKNMMVQHGPQVEL